MSKVKIKTKKNMKGDFYLYKEDIGAVARKEPIKPELAKRTADERIVKP
jgi:hypothetical protein